MSIAIDINIRFKEIQNKQFNYLTVVSIDYERTKRYRTHYFQCRCVCGRLTAVRYYNLINNAVKSCGCKRAEICGDLHWEGFEDISGWYWSNVQNNAKKRKLPFDLTKEYVWDLFLKQDKKCVLSGEPICFNSNHWKDKKNGTASLDRKDSSKGYIEGNVQWVHKDVNYMKQSMSDEEFILWIKKIHDFQTKLPCAK